MRVVVFENELQIGKLYYLRNFEDQCQEDFDYSYGEFLGGDEAGFWFKAIYLQEDSPLCVDKDENIMYNDSKFWSRDCYLKFEEV